MDELQAYKEFLSVISAVMDIAIGTGNLDLIQTVSAATKSFIVASHEDRLVFIRSMMNLVELEGEADKHETYILAWVIDETPFKMVMCDHYSIHESFPEAKAAYEALLEFPKLHSASVFGKVLLSTDY